MNFQVQMEEYFLQLAQMNPETKAVIIFDRGYLDNMAYMPKEAYEAFIRRTNVDIEEIRDTRYDMVLHMVTAANGAADKYTLANNQARSEGLQQAIDIDNRIKDAWNGHPNHM